MSRANGTAGSPPGGGINGLSFPSAKPNMNGSVAGPSGSKQTDLDGLNDSTNLAGIDLNAEEAGLRRAAGARIINVPRHQVVLNEKALQASVVKIAANFGLKFLEPDTLPLIALAVQHRLRGLVENMVAARDHRAGTSHLRPPPLYDRPDLVEAEIIAPMYDEVMYDDVEKVLATYDAVDRAEERRARIERSQREQAEKQEQIEREAAETAAKELAAEAAAEAAGGKKGKKKAMNATQAAKNVTEQQMHDLSMRTAARQLGGPALPAWAMGHVGPSTSSKPASALPTPAAAPGTPSTSMAAQQETYVPLSASIDRARMPLDSLDSFISWRDAVYALERERGVGSVGGSGSKVLHTTLAKRSTRRPP